MSNKAESALVEAKGRKRNVQHVVSLHDDGGRPMDERPSKKKAKLLEVEEVVVGEDASPETSVSSNTMDCSSESSLLNSSLHNTVPKPITITPRTSVLDLEDEFAAKVDLKEAKQVPEQMAMYSNMAISKPQLRVSTASNIIPSKEQEPQQQSPLIVTRDSGPLKFEYKARTQARLSFQAKVGALVVLLVLGWWCAAVLLPSPHPFASLETDDRSIYVSGGGFSGFWYTLGRLRSVSDPNEREYYCYSAGCLAVAGTLGNLTMEQLYNNAHSAQLQWQNGSLHRHDVVSAFIDRLLSEAASGGSSSTSDDMALGVASGLDDPFLLERMNIITTVENGWFGVKPAIRTPTSIQELRTMLLQTTWIPLATGGDLFHQQHMDGGFSLGHPKCAHKLGLATSPDVLLNFLNMNLSPEKVARFWDMGLEVGI